MKKARGSGAVAGMSMLSGGGHVRRLGCHFACPFPQSGTQAKLEFMDALLDRPLPFVDVVLCLCLLCTLMAHIAHGQDMDIGM